MSRRPICLRWLLATLTLGVGTSGSVSAQQAPRPTGQVSFHVDAVRRVATDGVTSRETTLSTSARFESPEIGAGKGFDFRVDMRYARTLDGLRPERVSFYDAYVGVHTGTRVQLRLRAGHMWLQDLGTIGALAGGLVEVGQPRSAAGTRFRIGAFAGREPAVYEMGYIDGVRKVGGYAAIESGYLRRHVVGYTRISNGALTERAVLSLTNYVPIGRQFLAYQAAEFDVRGPAAGSASSGLAYFMTNARLSPIDRLEVSGTYNRGRAIDARTLTNDLINGRPLTTQAVDGLRYESRSGRVSVEVFRGARVHVSYGQDRTNRDDELTGRVSYGGHASNLFRSRLDVSASDSRVDRASGAYHSRYVSIGRSLGRSVYVSGDYATSLSIVQFVRSDGLLIETRPWTRRLSATTSAAVGRHVWLSFTLDRTTDDARHEIRVLSGLTYRIR
jgi:hypothetical protein